MKKIFYTLLFVMSVITSFAQTLLVESFNYGSVADTLCGTGGVTTNWTPHSGTGTSPVLYSNTGLSYTGYNSGGTGGSLTMAHNTGTREDINRAFNAVTSGSVYASFLFRVTAAAGTTGDYALHLNDSQGSAISTIFRGRVFVRDSSTGFQVGISKGGAAAGATWGSTIYNLNQTYLGVLKYSFLGTPSGTDDSVYLYMFVSGVPTTEPTSGFIANNDATSDLTRARSICIRQGSVGTAAITFDEIRVGTTWANAPVPVTWKSINVNGTDNGNLLKWSTASETNNSHFEVQRSDNGKYFETIAKVKGKGTTSNVSYYSYNDVEGTQTEAAYYRLKQVDFDGKFEYSKVVVVNNEEEVSTGITTTLPNPFMDELVITVQSGNAATATVEVIDMIGKTHKVHTQQFSKGANKVEVNTTDMPNGIYFVRVTANGETFTKKVIKK